MASPASRGAGQSLKFLPPPLLAALLAAALLAAALAAGGQGAAVAEDDIRLPLEAVPRRYRIDIEAHLEGDFHFEGEVGIEVEAARSVDRLTFHRGTSLNVDLNSAYLHLLRLNGGEGDAKGGDFTDAATKERVITIISGKELEGADRVTLLLAEPLLAGRRYHLHLAFNGTLSDDLTGFYRVSYREGNETKWVASTVFEPTEARRAFPCFDEPALKARFQVNVARPEALVALSNMPLRETSPRADRPGWVWDHFEESPLMAPYLAAWTVGPLESRAAPGGRLRVWARPEALRDADYALVTAGRMQTLLTEWLGAPDLMPKTDLVALPSFVSDALENWGLISFGERYLLPHPNSSSAMGRVGFILGHELAHSWFGNMVTMDWWDAIWLNEGFATYFGSLALNGVQPELQVQSTTAVRAFLEVFSVDALRSSHALTATAAKSSDLHQIFDTTTYYKGYYVLRMLNHSLGEETFRRGIQRYVRDHRLGNVSERDLWAALGEQARLDGVALPARGDLAALMAAWTRRPGYPLLTLQRNYGSRAISIRQERFLRSPGDFETRSGAGDGGGEGGWWVPLTLTWAGGPRGWRATRPFAWLDPARSNTTLTGAELPRADNWLLANVEAAGLYRVNYDARNWAMLAAALRRDTDALAPLNRALLLDDALDLARAGRLPYSTALDVMRYMRAEKTLAPWLAALGDLDYLHRMLPGRTRAGDAFQRFLLQLLGPRFSELGLEPRVGELSPDTLQRRLLSRWACALGDARCVSEALKRFAAWRSDPAKHPITADMRSVVLCAAVEYGSRADWDFLWERFQNASSSSERSGVLTALGCSRDSETLQKLLQLSVQPGSPIRKQQSAAVFESVAKNPAGHAVAKTFLSNNIERIREYTGNNPFHLPQLLQALAYRMNTREELKQLEVLHEEHSDSLRAATRTLEQVYEAVRFNIDWMDRHGDQIATWLQSAPLPSASSNPSTTSAPATKGKHPSMAGEKTAAAA